jgi:hypothetical protein
MRTKLPSATAKRADGAEPMYGEQELNPLDSLLSSIARVGLRSVDGYGFGRERTSTGVGHAREEMAIASYHGRPDIEARLERGPPTIRGPLLLGVFLRRGRPVDTGGRRPRRYTRPIGRDRRPAGTDTFRSDVHRSGSKPLAHRDRFGGHRSRPGGYRCQHSSCGLPSVGDHRCRHESADRRTYPSADLRVPTGVRRLDVSAPP